MKEKREEPKRRKGKERKKEENEGREGEEGRQRRWEGRTCTAASTHEPDTTGSTVLVCGSVISKKKTILTHITCV